MKNVPGVPGVACSKKNMREEYGKNGRIWARRHFRKDKMCELTLNVYHEVLNMRRLWMKNRP